MCTCNRELYAKRRAAVFDAMAAREPESVAIFPAAPVYTRNNDVDHEYRQDSDLFYLTGFDEPSSVLILAAKDRKAVLHLLRELRMMLHDTNHKLDHLIERYRKFYFTHDFSNSPHHEFKR